MGVEDWKIVVCLCLRKVATRWQGGKNKNKNKRREYKKRSTPPARPRPPPFSTSHLGVCRCVKLHRLLTNTSRSCATPSSAARLAAASKPESVRPTSLGSLYSSNSRLRDPSRGAHTSSNMGRTVSGCYVVCGNVCVCVCHMCGIVCVCVLWEFLWWWSVCFVV